MLVIVTGDEKLIPLVNVPVFAVILEHVMLPVAIRLPPKQLLPLDTLSAHDDPVTVALEIVVGAAICKEETSVMVCPPFPDIVPPLIDTNERSASEPAFVRAITGIPNAARAPVP